MSANKLPGWCLGLLVLSAVLFAQETVPAPPQQTAPAIQQPSAVQQSAPAGEANTPQFPPTSDPKEIVRRSVEVDHRALEMARSYTCQHREVSKHLGKNGEVKSTEIKTFDINFYYGYEYSRLTQIDDKPLSEKEQKKEDEKLEKFLAKHRNESEEDRQKHLDKEKKEREEGRAFARDIVNAFDFRMVGEEKLEGVDTWVIEATPRKDFRPTQPHADMLKKVKGKMWIDKKEYNWVRVEAETMDTISFGLFLARIHAGSRFEFQQTHLNNEVWLMRRFYLNGSARLMLVKNEAIEEEDTYSNYKKFSTTVRIVPGVKEMPAEPPK
jgi:hypothetical protein